MNLVYTGPIITDRMVARSQVTKDTRLNLFYSEGFSIECQISRLDWSCITTLCDWLTKLAPLSQSMGIQTKTNRVFAARVFSRLAPVKCICFEF